MTTWIDNYLISMLADTNRQLHALSIEPYATSCACKTEMVLVRTRFSHVRKMRKCHHGDSNQRVCDILCWWDTSRRTELTAQQVVPYRYIQSAWASVICCTTLCLIVFDLT